LFLHVFRPLSGIAQPGRGCGYGLVVAVLEEMGQGLFENVETAFDDIQNRVR
jgi:hypothetical protein